MSDKTGQATTDTSDIFRQDGKHAYAGKAEYGYHSRSYNNKKWGETTWEDAYNAYNDWARAQAAGLGGSRAQAEMNAWQKRMGQLQGVHDSEMRMQEMERAMEEYREMFGEYMSGMNEYLSSMTEAMTYEEPAQEPLKQAQQAQTDARDDANRRQLLRRGLMSQYTRYGSQGQQRLGA